MRFIFFWKTVKQQQTQQFQKQGLCQSAPWGTVLPLFEKGSQYATEALMRLENIPSEMARAMTFQTNAVAAWEDTLLEMKHPHENPRSGCHQGPSISSESDQKNETSQNQLLQSLQQMYLDDQPAKKDQPTVKIGRKTVVKQLSTLWILLAAFIALSIHADIKVTADADGTIVENKPIEVLVTISHAPQEIIDDKSF